MQNRLAVFVIVGVIVILAVVYFVLDLSKPKNQVTTSQIYKTTSMKITSTAFNESEPIPQKYACDGESVNPPLEISDVPAGAKSLALIMHDPDAPISGGFTHWVMFNIPANVVSIAENSEPAGAEIGKNGAGKNSYTGPCPPSGTHRYYFYLYALNGKLNLGPDTDKTALEKAMEGKILAQAELMGTYAKK